MNISWRIDYVRKNWQNLTTKKIEFISVKWFYMIAEIKLGLHNEPDSLDVSKVRFAK